MASEQLQPSISACKKDSGFNNDLDSSDQLQPGISACGKGIRLNDAKKIAQTTGDLASLVLFDTKAE
eukprot:3073005-Karenia_brevis.AAC.1